MSDPFARSQELGLPVASMQALRHALEAELGPDAAARALQQAGYAAGDALYDAFVGQLGGLAPADLEQGEFWRRIAALFSERGWGSLHFDATHTGVGAIESSDWAEVDPAGGALRPSCHFTSGLFANLLGRTAGEEIGVLEVECRSRGDLHCRFLIGGGRTLGQVYETVRAGGTVDEALAQLA